MNAPSHSERQTPPWWQCFGLGVTPGWAVVALTAVAVTGAWREMVAVALPEEFVFRGVIQGEVARRSSSSWLAVAAAAAVFAVAHAAFRRDVAGLWTLFPGLLFGVLRAWSGSTWPAVSAHAVANWWYLDL